MSRDRMDDLTAEARLLVGRARAVTLALAALDDAQVALEVAMDDLRGGIPTGAAGQVEASTLDPRRVEPRGSFSPGGYVAPVAEAAPEPEPEPAPPPPEVKPGPDYSEALGIIAEIKAAGAGLTKEQKLKAKALSGVLKMSERTSPKRLRKLLDALQEIREAEPEPEPEPTEGNDLDAETLREIVWDIEREMGGEDHEHVRAARMASKLTVGVPSATVSQLVAYRIELEKRIGGS